MKRRAEQDLQKWKESSRRLIQKSNKAICFQFTEEKRLFMPLYSAATLAGS